MESKLKQIGSKVREEILKRSSILEFSKSVNVSRRTIHTIIKGEKSYNIDRLIIICEELGIEIFNLNENKLTECSSCGDKVEMISSGEFCPHCFC